MLSLSQGATVFVFVFVHLYLYLYLCLYLCAYSDNMRCVAVAMTEYERCLSCFHLLRVQTQKTKKEKNYRHADETKTKKININMQHRSKQIFILCNCGFPVIYQRHIHEK